MTLRELHSYGTPHHHARHLKARPGGLGPRERALWETVCLKKRDVGIVQMVELIDVFGSIKYEHYFGGKYRNDDFTDAILGAVVSYVGRSRAVPGVGDGGISSKLAAAFREANASLPRTMGCAVCRGERVGALELETTRQQRDSARSSSAAFETALHQERAENGRLRSSIKENDRSASILCWAIWLEPSHLIPGRWETAHGGLRTFLSREAADEYTRRLGLDGRLLMTRAHRVLPLYPPPL